MHALAPQIFAVPEASGVCIRGAILQHVRMHLVVPPPSGVFQPAHEMVILSISVEVASLPLYFQTKKILRAHLLSLC